MSQSTKTSTSSPTPNPQITGDLMPSVLQTSTGCMIIVHQRNSQNSLIYTASYEPLVALKSNSDDSFELPLTYLNGKASFPWNKFEEYAKMSTSIDSFKQFRCDLDKFCREVEYQMNHSTARNGKMFLGSLLVLSLGLALAIGVPNQPVWSVIIGLLFAVAGFVMAAYPLYKIFVLRTNILIEFADKNLKQIVEKHSATFDEQGLVLQKLSDGNKFLIKRKPVEKVELSQELTIRLDESKIHKQNSTIKKSEKKRVVVSNENENSMEINTGVAAERKTIKLRKMTAKIESPEKENQVSVSLEDLQVSMSENKENDLPDVSIPHDLPISPQKALKTQESERVEEKLPMGEHTGGLRVRDMNIELQVQDDKENNVKSSRREREKSPTKIRVVREQDKGNDIDVPSLVLQDADQCDQSQSQSQAGLEVSMQCDFVPDSNVIPQLDNTEMQINCSRNGLDTDRGLKIESMNCSIVDI